MSKIVKNTTLSAYEIADCGISIPAEDQYTVQTQDYWMWAASSDCVTGVGSGDLVINDGSNDLSISDGVNLIKHISPTKIQVIGANGTTVADIETEAGKNKMLMKGDIDVVNEYYGKDHFASAWAKITNAVSSTTITLNIG